MQTWGDAIVGRQFALSAGAQYAVMLGRRRPSGAATTGQLPPTLDVAQQRMLSLDYAVPGEHSATAVIWAYTSELADEITHHPLGERVVRYGGCPTRPAMSRATLATNIPLAPTGPDWLRKFADDGGTAIVSGDYAILRNWPDLVAYTETGLISFFHSQRSSGSTGLARSPSLFAGGPPSLRGEVEPVW